MFNKYQNIFRSRWKAVIWSAGILLTAYCTVPSPEGDKDPVVGLVKSYAGPASSPEDAPPEHINPWALDKPTHS